MNRPLRQRHRVTVTTLAVVLPVAFATGIAARKPAPVVAAQAFAETQTPTTFESIRWERADLWPKQSIRTRLLADGEGHVAVELSAAKEITKPDLLLYWVRDGEKVSDKLTEAASLMGVFSAHRHALPTDAAKQSGVLVLYSLADHQVITVSQPFNTQKD